MNEEMQKKVVALSAQLYLKLVPALVYDEHPIDQVANMSYEAAKAFYGVIAARLVEEGENAES